MFTYIKMKKQEWKLKLIVYGTVLKLIDEQKDIIDLIQKLYVALKDVSPEEMKDKMVEALAEIIHTENQKNNPTKTNKM